MEGGEDWSCSIARTGAARTQPENEAGLGRAHDAWGVGRLGMIPQSVGSVGTTTSYMEIRHHDQQRGQSPHRGGHLRDDSNSSLIVCAVHTALQRGLESFIQCLTLIFSLS